MSVKPAEILLSPYTLGDLKLKNGIVMSPLTPSRAANRGKVPNELMAEYYVQRAEAVLEVWPSNRVVADHFRHLYTGSLIIVAERDSGSPYG
jgi:2,4-dienoyl-CoA reductase-like NADH-dependent reductase (Old Yellow Enzyme family)